MNRVVLTGRIANDLDLRYTNDEKAMLSFKVAVKRKFKNAEGKYDADFISCKAYKAQAEFIGKYFEKGNWIELEGEIRTGSYTNKEGQKVYTTDVIVSECGFVGDKEKKEDDNGFAPVNEGFM